MAGGRAGRQRPARPGRPARGPRPGAGAGLGTAGAARGLLIIDFDATLLDAHSDKEGAAGTYKGGFGFHPLLATWSGTGEALAGILRPGNAGANTAADHIEVVDLALAQLPAEHLDREILVRADIGGATHALTDHLPRAGVRFSIGSDLPERVRAAILALPERRVAAGDRRRRPAPRRRLGGRAHRPPRPHRLARTGAG